MGGPVFPFAVLWHFAFFDKCHGLEIPAIFFDSLSSGLQDKNRQNAGNSMDRLNL